MPDQVPSYLPSPNKILAECRRIRSQWSEAQRLTRIMDDSTRRGETGVVDIPIISNFAEDEDGPGIPWRHRRRAVPGDV